MIGSEGFHSEGATVPGAAAGTLLAGPAVSPAPSERWALFPTLEHTRVGEGLHEPWIEDAAMTAARPGQLVHVACGQGRLHFRDRVGVPEVARR
jgi:hypothetical protein